MENNYSDEELIDMLSEVLSLQTELELLKEVVEE